MRSGLRALSEIARFDEEADVVVVGLGCAGAAAAIEAAHAGARTVVLERASGGGGTSALSGGVLYLGGGTQLQRACGFEDSPEAMFEYLMASVGDAPDEAKIAPLLRGQRRALRLARGAGRAVQGGLLPRLSRRAADRRRPRLVGLGALPPLLRRGEAGAARSRAAAPASDRPRADEAPDRGRGRAARASTGDTRVTRARRGRDGAVAGVVAQRSARSAASARARGVVLATGGFIHNDDMLAAARAARAALQGARGRGGRRRLRHPARHGGGRRHAAHGQGVDLAARHAAVGTQARRARRTRTGSASSTRTPTTAASARPRCFHQGGRAWLIVDDEVFEQPDYVKRVGGGGRDARGARARARPARGQPRRDARRLQPARRARRRPGVREAAPTT